MSCEDDDVATAVIARWRTSATLPVLVPGDIERGEELSSYQPGEPPERRVARRVPYATLDVKQGPDANIETAGGDYVDHRHVTIAIYGLEADVATALSAARTRFIRQALDVSNVTAFMACLDIPGEGGLKRAEGHRAGEHIWVGTLALVVKTHRSY